MPMGVAFGAYAWMQFGNGQLLMFHCTGSSSYSICLDVSSLHQRELPGKRMPCGDHSSNLGLFSGPDCAMIR